MDSESSKLLQALHIFNNQFACYILASQQAKIRSQQQLDLSTERATELELHVDELNKEVSLIRYQMNEVEATKKEEAEEVRYLREELEALKQLRNADISEAKLRHEEEKERVRLLARLLEKMPVAESEPSRASLSAEMQEVLKSRTHTPYPEIPPPVEPPILNLPADHGINSEHHKPQKQGQINNTVTIKVYFATSAKNYSIGNYTPTLAAEPDVVVNKCLVKLARQLARLGAIDCRLWRIPAAKVAQSGWYYPIDNIGKHGKVIDTTVALRLAGWMDGDAIVIEPKLSQGWLSAFSHLGFKFLELAPPPREIFPENSPLQSLE